MRILVTGATGFVGRWLIRELEGAGHDTVPAPAQAVLDITDGPAVSAFVNEASPDAIAHLAGVAFAMDAAQDPQKAFAVNEGGTRAVMNAALPSAIPVLIAGSADVYGRPAPGDLPLNEHAPLLADRPYGRSKLAQERTALEFGAAGAVPVVVTRSFNHTGPGQRPEFVAPALARRLLAARDSGRGEVAVGNLDVRRDIGDVRDVVRAYRLLLEGLAAGAVPSGTIVNVATGQAVSIREVLALLAEAIGIAVEPRVDPTLVRRDDPPLIVADIGRIRALTGWTPEIPLRQTLSDLVQSIDKS